MAKLLEELKRNGLDYCTKENFISIGSTRAVFGVGDYVVKQHVFPCALEQSKKEFEIYESLPEHLKKWFTMPYYICEEYAVFERVEPLSSTPWMDEFDLDVHGDFFSSMDFEELQAICLKGGIAWEELIEGCNLGRKDLQLKFLDYGLSFDFFEKYYSLKANGFIPYIDYGACQCCNGDLFIPIFDEKDPDFSFGFCTCGKYPTEYPIDEVRNWYLNEKQLKF